MRFRSHIDRPDLLEVRCGHLGRRLLLVPVDDVAFVEPQERMVVLQAPDPFREFAGSSVWASTVFERRRAYSCITRLPSAYRVSVSRKQCTGLFDMPRELHRLEARHRRLDETAVAAHVAD